MRWTQSSGTMRCVLLAALLGSIGTHAAVTDSKKPIQTKPVSAVADTQASAHHQGAFKASGVNWTCKGSHCSASALPSAVETPLTACQELAREVGAIKSFKIANHALNAKELQQCNSGVAGFSAAAQAPIASDLKKNLPATSKAERKASPYPENWTQPDLPAGKSQVFKDMKNELGKKDKAAMTSAKKPPVAKGVPPSSTPVPRPAGPFMPVALRTPQLTLTGIGVAEVSYRFTPVAVRTPQLTLTGMGVAETTYRFTPVAVRTPQLTLTGTGRSE